MALGTKSKDTSKERAHKKKFKSDKIKKHKEGKNERDSESKDKKIQTVIKKVTPLSMYVCGHPNVIEMFMQKKNELNFDVDEYRVNFNIYPGNTDDGQLNSGDADFFLCVYDVRNSDTVDFLRQRILPKVKALSKGMAVAGLGLEYRNDASSKHITTDTVSKLISQFGCKGAELVYCDKKQMGAGAFALYAAANPEEFLETTKKDDENKENDDGKKMKKKKKREKKDEKEKKEKREKEKKKKKKKKDKYGKEKIPKKEKNKE